MSLAPIDGLEIEPCHGRDGASVDKLGRRRLALVEQLDDATGYALDRRVIEGDRVVDAHRAPPVHAGVRLTGSVRTSRTNALCA